MPKDPTNETNPALVWFVALVAFEIISRLSKLFGNNISSVLSHITSFRSVPGVCLLAVIVILMIMLSGRGTSRKRS